VKAGLEQKNQLNVWVDGLLAAVLRVETSAYTLQYNAEWQGSGRGFAFSPHLPLNLGSNTDVQTASSASVKNFFSNLLPEGQPLEELSKAHQVSQHDVFGILQKVGRDCAGALVLTPDATPPQIVVAFDPQDYEQISQTDMQGRITESRAQNVPLMFWRGLRRMSLPGVQNKLGVYQDMQERLWLPKDGEPTSHILKVGDAHHPGMVANEFFCMKLAKAIGLNVPDVQYLELPEPVLLVKRYDREWTTENGLLRTHQIDGCQALNLPPEQKYEEPHYTTAPPGATFADLFALCRVCKIPAAAQIAMLQWLLFNFLIGNTDAHAKNLSFLVSREGVQVAPLYDLVSGVMYRYQDMAQSIGGETNVVVIRQANWAALASDCGIPLALLQRLARQMGKQVRLKLAATNRYCGLRPENELIIAKLNFDGLPQ
jgi:serine/threonine-protein kinase HipA